MTTLSNDLRERIVSFWHASKNHTYKETARVFSVGAATVNRLLRRHRETGGIMPLPRGGNNPRRVCLVWLKTHAEQFPDARIRDRIEDYYKITEKRVSIGAMHNALYKLGWSHKKKLFLQQNKIQKKQQHNALNLRYDKKN